MGEIIDEKLRDMLPEQRLIEIAKRKAHDYAMMEMRLRGTLPPTPRAIDHATILRMRYVDLFKPTHRDEFYANADNTKIAMALLGLT